MNDVTYITIEDLKELTSISENIDVKYIVPYIVTSQVMFVEPLLGIALDTYLKNQITGGTLSGYDERLVKYYIRPYAVYTAFIESLPFISMKITSKGIVKQASENSEAATTDDINWLTTKGKDKQSAYKALLLDYLECNADKFPLYRVQQRKTYSSGIYLGPMD